MLIYFYRPNKNASRTDITNYDKKDYAFVPTYGYESTGYHHHIISGVVFSYSNKIQIMLVDYTFTEMGCFYDYSDAAPSAKTMRGNGITTLLLHVAQCITFNKKKFVTTRCIAKVSLKPLYSRLGFKVFKDFAEFPIHEEACKRFHYESGKSKAL